MVLQNMVALERSIRESRESDKPLVNWWLYLLLLSWLTLGIYVLIVFVQRITRRDNHFARKNRLYNAMLQCTREVADAKGIDIGNELRDLEYRIRQEEPFLQPKGAVLWFFLTLITAGLAGLYVYYFLTSDWYRLQRVEQTLLDDFSKVWIKLGIIKYPITAEMAVPERNFWLYLLLSIVSAGIWGLYWDYCIHTDPDKVFKESARWEETVLQSFRQV